MKIKVSEPDVQYPNKKVKQDSKQNSKQKSARMTLQEYIQSTNLKRRIHSRSKGKQNKKATLNGHNLQPPITNQTFQFFKLNQEWKSKKIFSSWIVHLKQMCREFISNDQSYVEVIRLIQKLSQFVKNQIETIKKDNLLLQSYLVTQASYWPAEGSACDQENNDKISNYLKTLIGKSEYFNSPCKSQAIDSDMDGIKNRQKNNDPGFKQKDLVEKYKTASQPKKYSSANQNKSTTGGIQNQQRNLYQQSLGKQQITKRDASKNLRQNLPHTSSTGNKLNESHEQNRKVLHSQKEQYIYSFKDKPNQRGARFVFNTNSELKDVTIEPFNQDFNQHLQPPCDHDFSEHYQFGLLRINSHRQQDEIPRLSLMSRYDQNKNQKMVHQNKNSHGTKQTQNNAQCNKNDQHINGQMRIKSIQSSNVNQIFQKTNQDQRRKATNQSNLSIDRQNIDHDQSLVKGKHQKFPQNGSNLSKNQISTKSQIESQKLSQSRQQNPSKVPLRQRKQRASYSNKSYDQRPAIKNEFQMVVLENRRQNRGRINQITEKERKEMTEKKISEKTEKKINIKELISMESQIGSVSKQQSPSNFNRSSVNLISLATPSTLKRKQDSSSHDLPNSKHQSTKLGRQFDESYYPWLQNEGQKSRNPNHKFDIKQNYPQIGFDKSMHQPTHQLINQACLSAAVHKLGHEEKLSSLARSRQNIMGRYENYRKN